MLSTFVVVYAGIGLLAGAGRRRRSSSGRCHGFPRSSPRRSPRRSSSSAIIGIRVAIGFPMTVFGAAHHRPAAICAQQPGRDRRRCSSTGALTYRVLSLGYRPARRSSPHRPPCRSAATSRTSGPRGGPFPRCGCARRRSAPSLVRRRHRLQHVPVPDRRRHSNRLQPRQRRHRRRARHVRRRRVRRRPPARRLSSGRSAISSTGCCSRSSSGSAPPARRTPSTALRDDARSTARASRLTLVFGVTVCADRRSPRRSSCDGWDRSSKPACRRF